MSIVTTKISRNHENSYLGSSKYPHKIFCISLIAVFLSFRIYQISQQKEFETVNNIEDVPMNDLRTFHEKKNNDNNEENDSEPGCEMKLICNNCI